MVDLNRKWEEGRGATKLEVKRMCWKEEEKEMKVRGRVGGREEGRDEDARRMARNERR